MGMVSMKVEGSGVTAMPDNPYGYGLCIYLNEDQVEALGLKDNAPKAGSSVALRAMAVIVSKTEDADLDEDGDGVDVSLRIQITDLEVLPQGSAPITGSMLYGG